MTRIKNLIAFGNRFIDYKMGVAGAIVMAGIVFAINYYGTKEISGSTTAALKQGSYTFLFGGILMKGCENLAVKIRNRIIAIAAAIIIPSALTLFLTFQLHQLKGTPKPVESTFPTLIIIPATAVWGYKKRKQKEDKLSLLQ